MKLPYGISNFKTLREEGYLYIDKTRHLDILENFGGRYLFFSAAPVRKEFIFIHFGELL